MNYSFDNIEYRPFPAHKYRVGYATRSGVWHVHGQSGDYRAICVHFPLPSILATTLAEVSAQLRAR